MQLGWGVRPPSGAVGCALAAHYVHRVHSLFGALVHAVFGAGAPNCSRGGCAPHSFQLHRCGL